MYKINGFSSIKTQALVAVRSLWGKTLIGLISLSVSFCSGPQTLAQSITPFSADAFVDSVGIVTHLGYADTAYGQNWGKEDPSQNVEVLLADLGVRHVRDSIPHPTLQPARAYARPRLAQLYREHGIRFIAPLDQRSDHVLTPDQIDPYLRDYANSSIVLNGERINVRDLLEAIEGPNEYDRHNRPDNREKNWGQNLKDYQATLYEGVKGNSQLSHIPVVMPSLVYTRYCTSVLGNIGDVIDYGNLHAYPTYPYFRMPTATFEWHMNHGQSCYGEKPVYITETGYMTNGGGISDRTIAKYLSRLLPEFFLQPQVERTYLYSLIDTRLERPWGLVQAEPNGQTIGGFEQFTLTPKPAYNAVRSLLALLNESAWEPSQKRWVTPTTDLTPVSITLRDNQNATHYLLLQKSTEDYFLLLWQKVEVFNPEQGNFDSPPDEVTVSLPEGYRFQDFYRYNENFVLEKTPLAEAPNVLTVEVPDNTIVLHFKG